MTVLVDSDILIEVARGKDQAVIAQWLALSNSEAIVLYSPVSVAELWADALPREHQLLDRLFLALTCVPIDAAIGHQAGCYLKRYRKSHAIETADALIAAAAVSQQARLWTRNRKHYPMKDVTFFT